MNDSMNRFSDERIDRLVRSYLSEEIGRVDVPAQVRELERRVATIRASASPPLRFRKAARWSLSLAASLLIVGLGLNLFFSPRTTSAYSMVSAARQVIAQQADYCYQVETNVPAAWLKGQPLLRFGSQAKMWTRGSLFRVEVSRDSQRFSWGQDETGRVWFDCYGEYGLEFEPEQTPPAINTALSFLHLDMSRLMTRFLHSFDLEFEPTPQAANEHLLVIRATARPDAGRVRLNSARLTIERGSNVIRRLELSRSVKGETKGTIAFVLLPSQPQSAAGYQLSGNLPAQAPVYRGAEALQRFQQLRETLPEN